MRSMKSGKDTRWPEGGTATYERINGSKVNLFTGVQKRAKIEELTNGVEDVPVEIGNIFKYVNLYVHKYVNITFISSSLL